MRIVCSAAALPRHSADIKVQHYPGGQVSSLAGFGRIPASGRRFPNRSANRRGLALRPRQQKRLRTVYEERMQDDGWMMPNGQDMINVVRHCRNGFQPLSRDCHRYESNFDWDRGRRGRSGKMPLLLSVCSIRPKSAPTFEVDDGAEITLDGNTAKLDTPGVRSTPSVSTETKNNKTVAVKVHDRSKLTK
jgi:hypothetical protein